MKLSNLLKCGYQNNMKISETDDTFYLDLHFFLNKAVDTYGKWNQKPLSHVNGENFLKDFFQSFYSKSQTFHIKISYFFFNEKRITALYRIYDIEPYDMFLFRKNTQVLYNESTNSENCTFTMKMYLSHVCLLKYIWFISLHIL